MQNEKYSKNVPQYRANQLITMCDNDKAQALHYAVEKRCENSVKILLKNEAPVNDKCRPHTAGT